MFVLEPRVYGDNSFTFSISLINEDQFGNRKKEILIYEEEIWIDVSSSDESGADYDESRSITVFGNKYEIKESNSREYLYKEVCVEKNITNEIDISSMISSYDFDVLTIINSIFETLYGSHNEQYTHYKYGITKKNIISKALLLFLQKNNLKLFDFNNVLLKLKDTTGNQQNFTYLFELDSIKKNNDKLYGKTDETSVLNKFSINPNSNIIYNKIQNIKPYKGLTIKIERKINLYTGVNDYSLEII